MPESRANPSSWFGDEMNSADLVDHRFDLGSFDAMILGAGISGLVSASVLSQQGCSNIVVVDEYAHVGGNHIDCTIGPYTFDIGSLIFQDDSPLLAHFPGLLPHYVPINPTWGRLNPQGVVTEYPISFRVDLFGAGPAEWVRILSSVAFCRLFRRKLSNARDFAQFWVGARLLNRSGLEHYMKRFYGLPPEQIDIKFAESRMLWIKEHASLRRWLPFSRGPNRRRQSKDSVPNRQLARPREGFARLYQAASDQLEQHGVKFLLGTDMRSLQKEGGVFVLDAGGRRLVAKRVVSTVPLPRVQRLCDMHLDENLRTITLISLFFSFSGTRGFGYSILYNFSHAGAWKRLTIYSDFYGPIDGREYFAVEVNADHVSGSVEAAAEDFRRHTSENRLFDGDLRLEGSHSISNAYPIYTDHADQRAASAISRLKEFGIESLGRQGGFDYQPTSRDTTLKAEAALRQT
jgi:protoporphyrinogen oxidase